MGKSDSPLDFCLFSFSFVLILLFTFPTLFTHREKNELLRLISVYMDDFCCFAHTIHQLLAQYFVFVIFATMIGFQFKNTKLEFLLTEGIIQGIGLDTSTWTVYIPKKKQDKFFTLYANICKHTPSVKHLQEIQGTINHFQTPLPHLKCYCGNLNALIGFCSKKNLTSICRSQLPNYLKRCFDSFFLDMSTVVDILKSNLRYSVPSMLSLLPPGPSEIFVDACTDEFGIGGYFFTAKNKLKAFQISLDDIYSVLQPYCTFHSIDSEKIHISMLEYLAVLVVLTCFPDNFRNKAFIIRSDNSPTVSWLNSWRIPIAPFHLLSRLLVLTQLELNCRLRGIHILGPVNFNADYISRTPLTHFSVGLHRTKVLNSRDCKRLCMSWQKRLKSFTVHHTPYIMHLHFHVFSTTYRTSTGAVCNYPRTDYRKKNILPSIPPMERFVNRLFHTYILRFPSFKRLSGLIWLVSAAIGMGRKLSTMATYERDTSHFFTFLHILNIPPPEFESYSVSLREFKFLLYFGWEALHVSPQTIKNRKVAITAHYRSLYTLPHLIKPDIWTLFIKGVGRIRGIYKTIKLHLTCDKFVL